MHLNGFTRTDQPEFSIQSFSVWVIIRSLYFSESDEKLVKFWPKQTVRIVVYLDDGIGGAKTRSLAFEQSKFVFKTLCLAGFTTNQDKSVWWPGPLSP